MQEPAQCRQIRVAGKMALGVEQESLSDFYHEVEESTLDTPTKEKWQVLCEQISVEGDSDRLMALIEELNQVLQAREKQIRSKASEPENAA